jgi:acyl-CoA reductase-like NAD-dependent aldehyde dehydrogenase
MSIHAKKSSLKLNKKGRVMSSWAPVVSGTRTDRKQYDGFDFVPIAGIWREGRSPKNIEDVDPYRGDTLLTLTAASAEDVDEAYRKAAEAQRGWAAALPQTGREVLIRAAHILVERKDEIAGWLMREAGGTRSKASTEWQLVHQGTFEAATYPFRMTGEILPCSIPVKESRGYRKPVGVVSPWDFALQLINRSVAPALATGNAVVLKPALTTPVTGGLLFAKLYEEAGLPPGVLSVVLGSSKDIGDALVTHPVPRFITFTGSTAVGRHIGELAAKHVKRSALELGGNAPFTVLDDADLDIAVNIAGFGKLLNSGQICMAINRIIVDAQAYDAFLDCFTKRVAALRCGDPGKEDTDLGSIIDQRQFDNIRKLVDGTVAAGARVVHDGPSERRVMHPVIFADVTNDMPAARNEIFGPVASIIKVDGEEEAIRVPNDTEYGLSSAVCTRNLARGVSVARRFEAGMTHINDIPVNDEANRPLVVRSNRATDVSAVRGHCMNSPPSIGSQFRNRHGGIHSKWKLRTTLMAQMERTADVDRSHCFEDKDAESAIGGISTCIRAGNMGHRGEPCETTRRNCCASPWVRSRDEAN